MLCSAAGAKAALQIWSHAGSAMHSVRCQSRCFECVRVTVSAGEQG